MYECNKAWEEEKTKQNLPFFCLGNHDIFIHTVCDKEE
jgi:hypothetical protein